MSLLLDTHALLWWASGDMSRLTRSAARAIDDARQDGLLFASSISAWEIAMLVARGRLELTMPVEAWLARLQKSGVVLLVPVDTEIALESVMLPGEFHKDPADRFIVATARKRQVPLVTADERIRGYPHVRTIW